MRIAQDKLEARVGAEAFAALAFALANAGSSIPARMAMMAMTTSNSISVKAALCFRLIGWADFFMGTF